MRQQPTNIAYDGVPVRQYYVVLWLDEQYVEGLVWAESQQQAFEFARLRWPNGLISVQPEEAMR